MRWYILYLKLKVGLRVKGSLGYIKASLGYIVRLLSKVIATTKTNFK